MGRRERQREQILAALEGGDYSRALVLAREHLVEFPDDEEVAAAATQARRARDGTDASE